MSWFSERAEAKDRDMKTESLYVNDHKGLATVAVEFHHDSTITSIQVWNEVTWEWLPLSLVTSSKELVKMKALCQTHVNGWLEKEGIDYQIPGTPRIHSNKAGGF